MTYSAREAAPLTEDWLRSVGFKWHEVDRSEKHWLLWIAGARRDRHHGFDSPDEFGIELCPGNAERSWWYCWFRGDLAGRYSRFLFARNVETTEHVIRLIEAITDQPWDPANVMYGYLTTPEHAARMRADADRLDRRIAESQARGYGEDGDPAEDRRWGDRDRRRPQAK